MCSIASSIRHRLSTLLADGRGVVSIEYIVIGGLVALGFTVAATALAGDIGTALGNIGTYITGSITPG